MDKYHSWLRGAMAARLTPDQKAACSNHVGVSADFYFGVGFILRNKEHNRRQEKERTAE